MLLAQGLATEPASHGFTGPRDLKHHDDLVVRGSTKRKRLRHSGDGLERSRDRTAVDYGFSSIELGDTAAYRQCVIGCERPYGECKSTCQTYMSTGIRLGCVSCSLPSFIQVRDVV
jgi:hypothetical protein